MFVKICSTSTQCRWWKKFLFFRCMLFENRSNGWRNWLEAACDCLTLSEAALWCCELWQLSASDVHVLCDNLYNYVIMDSCTKCLKRSIHIGTQLSRLTLCNSLLCDAKWKNFFCTATSCNFSVQVCPMWLGLQWHMINRSNTLYESK